MIIASELATVDYLDVQAFTCDKCSDLTVGIHLVLRSDISSWRPFLVNIMIPTEAFLEIVKRGNAAIAAPFDSINGEAIPTAEESWYEVDHSFNHD